MVKYSHEIKIEFLLKIHKPSDIFISTVSINKINSKNCQKNKINFILLQLLHKP